MTTEELNRHARIQAEDSMRYCNLSIDELTIGNIAEHIRDAWLEGEQYGKQSQTPRAPRPSFTETHD
jgi:hypothetical protein